VASIKMYSPLFLAPLDEVRFEEELRRVNPHIQVIEGSVWRDDGPNVKESIKDCTASVIFLWNSELYPQLPSIVRKDGRRQGPTSGVVIQFIRSTIKDGLLLSGDLGIGISKEDVPMQAFCKNVWRILRSLNFSKLNCIDKTTGDVKTANIDDYIVGEGAVELSNSGMLLKHCATDVYYRPAAPIKK